MAVAQRARAASTTARPTAVPRRPAPAPRRPRPVEAVRPASPHRPVGLVGSLAAALVFCTLFALAALHALQVQTQTRIDALENANVERAERVDELRARIAHLDSPRGIAEAATRAGLVRAPEIVGLGPLPPGALAPPPGDPGDGIGPLDAADPGDAGTGGTG